ncbi:MAG: carboxypeptidase M32 [Treponema sp.]|jgi:carboxypeptidase Taq|nr:carboxypeptidase M32 [Treponema sp.]
MDKAAALERLRALDRERMYLSQAAAILQWDQETYLPPEGVEDRAEQLALLEGLAHEKLTDPQVGRLLDELDPAAAEDPAGSAAGLKAADGTFPAADGFPAGDFLRVLRRDYDRAVKLPADFVRDRARAEGLSQAAWVKARRDNDFAAFAPHLEKMVALEEKKARYWGWGAGAAGFVYDGLLDFHEPGFSAASASALFGPLGERLSLLLREIAGKTGPSQSPGTGPSASPGGPGADKTGSSSLAGPGAFLRRAYGASRQEAFCRRVLGGLGFDFNRGRLDTSAHPFTTTLGFNDARITTRYAAGDPLSALFSVIHEGGHAFYELGADPVLRSSCLAGGVSMGIHESQSRLWENVIGRGRAFWRPWFPRFKKSFPRQLEGVDFGTFYRAMNTVSPSLIRVDADELSYSLHIILRFELEQRLFDGSLRVSALPAAWNAGMKKYLGVEPANDAEGVLQDVHWSMGAFGYFPSYALGNLYGLQFWEKLNEDLPGVNAALEKEDYAPIHRWLREKIYRWGRRREPARLLEEVTGQTLSAGPFLRYLEEKYGELYGF